MKPSFIVIVVVGFTSATGFAEVVSNASSSASGGMVQGLVTHKAELATLAGAISRSATHEAIAEGEPQLAKSIHDDVATNGELSQAIKGMATAVVQDQIGTSSNAVRAGLTEACGAMLVGDCIRAQARAMSREVTRGMVDELERRWPVVLFGGVTVVFLLTATVLMLATLRRLLRDTHSAGSPHAVDAAMS